MVEDLHIALGVMAREELEAARQREGDTTECLLQCRTEKQSLESQVEWLTVQLDQCQAQKFTVKRNMERACSTTRGNGTTTIQKRGGTRREMGGPRETPRTAVARANSKMKTSRSQVTGAQAKTGSLSCCGGECC